MRKSYMPVGIEIMWWIIGLSVFGVWLEKNHYWEDPWWLVALVAVLIWRVNR